MHYKLNITHFFIKYKEKINNKKKLISSIEEKYNIFYNKIIKINKLSININKLYTNKTLS
jgi:hypothetical protein